MIKSLPVRHILDHWIGITMRETIDSFLNHLVVEKGFSKNTQEAYKNDLGQFIDYANKNPNGHNGTGHPYQSWQQVDLDLLTQYVSSLRKQKSYSESTTARKVAALKSFFNFLVQEEAIQQDPSEFLSIPRVGRSLPKFLTEEEVQRLLDLAGSSEGADGARDRAIIELLYATGLRVTELISLNVHDVNIKEGYVRCFGKGGKERIVYIYPRAAQVLNTYLEEARPLLRPLSPAKGSRAYARLATATKSGKPEEKALFLNRRGERLTRQWIWAILKSYAEKARLNKSLTPHTLRHSFATHMLRGGASLRHVQELLGHSSITTTQIYTHLTDEHVRQEFDRSHPRS